MALRAGAQAGVPFSAELEGQSGESGYREIKTSRHRILCLLVCLSTENHSLGEWFEKRLMSIMKE